MPWNNGDTSMSLRASRTVGYRSYELSDHLGNVLATVLDRKTGVLASGSSTLYDRWKADVTSLTDYYPFGMQMPGRTYEAGVGLASKFGFNGKQKDDEISVRGGWLDFGSRNLDVRIGRFSAVDRKSRDYSAFSPYCFVTNSPIWAVDPDGDGVYIVIRVAGPLETDGSITSSSLTALDVTNAKDVARLLKEGSPTDIQLYQHHVDAKQVPMGKLELEYYEGSGFEHLYFTNTTIDRAGQVGATYQNVVDKDGDGSLSLKDMGYVDNTPELATLSGGALQPFNGFVGLSINTKGVNSLIAMDVTNLSRRSEAESALGEPSLTANVLRRENITALIHETYAHVTLAHLGYTTSQQHTKFFNKATDDPSKATLGSLQRELVDQVKEAFPDK